MAGQDVIISAQTGSGKTLAFALPFIATILAGRSDAPAVPAKSLWESPLVLVLTPGSELGDQVSQAIQAVSPIMSPVRLGSRAEVFLPPDIAHRGSSQFRTPSNATK